MSFAHTEKLSETLTARFAEGSKVKQKGIFRHRNTWAIMVSMLVAVLAVSFLAFPASASISVHSGVSSIHALTPIICTVKSDITGDSGSEVITPAVVTDHGYGPLHAACIHNLTKQNESLTFNGQNICGLIPPDDYCGVWIKKPPLGRFTFRLAPPASSATWTVIFKK